MGPDIVGSDEDGLWSQCSSPSSLLVKMKNTFLHFQENFMDSPREEEVGGSRLRSFSDSSCGSCRRAERFLDEETSAEFVLVMEETPPSTVQPSNVPPEEKTTVMLRNIPNKYTQKMLIDCLNEKGFHGKFDFLYLPVDFRNVANVGYAFINFDSESTLEEFRNLFEGYKLPGFNSQKVCSVGYARVQGLSANVEHYKNSPVNQVTIPEYKPLVLPLLVSPSTP